jgi:hypothetical protein
MAGKTGTLKNAGKMQVLAPTDAALGVLAQPPLLATESRTDFEALLKALQRESKPKGVIGNMYVAEMAEIVWEILRLRRCKTAIINAAYFGVLKDILPHISQEPRTATPHIPAHTFKLLSPHDFDTEEVPSRPFTQEEQKRENLPFAWFHDKRAKDEVARKLAKFGLNESVIDARAMRSVWEDLELLDDMLVSLESRRDKLLRQIETYRHGFAERVSATANRIIDAESEDVLVPPKAPANINSAA